MSAINNIIAQIVANKIPAILTVTHKDRTTDQLHEEQVFRYKLKTFISVKGIGEVTSFTEVDGTDQLDEHPSLERRYRIRLLLIDNPDVIAKLIAFIKTISTIVGSFSIIEADCITMEPTHRPSERFGDGISHRMKRGICQTNCFYMDEYNEAQLAQLHLVGSSCHE